MAYSYVQYTGNGATTNFAFSFPYLDSSHIKVRVDGVITSFTFVNSGTVQISPAPLAGKIIDIRRETPKNIAPVNFTDGSVLLEQDLDLLAAFNLYTSQEAADGVADAIVKDTTGVWDAQSRRIKSVADPINANDAVNKTWAETAMSSQLASATAQATISTTKAGEAAASASSASTSASTATSKASEAAASATSASNSATSASGSASTATTKASEALASQVAAAASASTASTKASEANTSAGNAASSASTASTQAGIATTKATEASNSASAAATSASTATTKADSATASASAAASSAATATTKASEASSDAASAATSASNAASSATSAANSAAQATTNGAAQVTLAAAQVALATTQANNAASSASASAASASDSANSATSAAASAASAAAILDNFDDRYLGSKSSAPTVDNDGNALLIGSLYFDSTTGKMRVYTASGWIDASSASVATLGTFKFTATAGQTSFSGTGDTGVALSYTVGAVIVSLNGVLLEEGSEYTASTGSSIVLASGASAGDELNVYAFGNFLVADTYSRAEADALLNAKQPLNSELTAIASSGNALFKNRIINGAMMIDQRNAGASVTPASGAVTYVLDRWNFYVTQASKLTVQQSSTAPAGFTKSMLVTSSSAYSVTSTDRFQFTQPIEGYNVADLGWGTASATTVTLSFWVRSSLTGTFGGAIKNATGTRSYPFSYTISSANTWEQKTVTVVGDTTGTWSTDNTGGILITFGVGTGSTFSGTAGAWAAANYDSATGATSVVGTNGATFYITGVQLEKGSTATSFDYRPYGTELQLCQRYYQQIGSGFYGATEGTSTFNLQVPYWQQMRASATVAGISGRIFSCRYAGDTNITNPTLTNIASGNENVWLQVVSSGLTSGVPIYGRSQNIGSSNFLSASAEL